MTSPVLQLEDLRVSYVDGDRRVSAVDGITLDVRAGETLGIVGESGCGKTTLVKAVMGLLPPTAQIDGQVRFGEEDLTTASDATWRRLRGDRMSMIFQDPLSSLDPTFSIGYQVAETILAHHRVSRSEARRRAVELLGEVGIPAAEERYDDPPHRLSGGMRQRVVIAAALANDPALILADEPTTALDVTIQAQILALLDGLKQRHNGTVVFITHDLGVVAQICDRVGVMYAGQLVELAPTVEIFERPRHPYTRALLESLPSAIHGPGMLPVIEGRVPDLDDPGLPGCRFAPRCPHRMPVCDDRPATTETSVGHLAACWLDDDAHRPATDPRGAASARRGGSR